MSRLCIYLPPFASDYSGVCSALFDLDCMSVINDAACCTSHYVFYDEPRWNEHVRPFFSTALRNIDAILGNDDKIVAGICEAARGISTEMIAVVGTPVPAISGMDMEGIPSEIEFRTGKPSFGFNTTGFSYYDKGIVQAGKVLIDRFAEPAKTVKGRVNIVGMTPLDFGTNGNDESLIKLLESAGWQIGCRFFMGLTLSELHSCASAELNLAVSSAGLSLAKYLKRKFGTPYVTGLPMGKEHAKSWLLSLRKRGAQKKDAVIHGKRLLIVSDQVVGNALRSALRHHDAGCSIDVASFFGWDTDIMERGDLHLEDEAQYLGLLKTDRYFALAADPILMDVQPASGLRRLELVHPAVSSKLSWDKAPCFLDAGFSQRMNTFIGILSEINQS